MDDQSRLDLILAQARIAKKAMATELRSTDGQTTHNIDQALLALEAIVLLADPEFHNTSSAA